MQQSERHLTFPLKAGALVPWRIAIIMAEETDVLAMAVKDRSDIVWGWEKPTQISFG